MKIGGFRKPSLSSSIKARTTGKAKRAVKSAVNPLYGKKGVGMLKDPGKAVKNKVYKKTTVGLSDLFSSTKEAKGGKALGGESGKAKDVSAASKATETERKYHKKNTDTAFLAQQNAKRYKLEGAGVDLSFATETKAKSDAIKLLGDLFPIAKNLSAGFGSSDCDVEYEDLTKSGKVPKNVVKASMIADGGESDTVIAHIRYSASGLVNMADFHLWRNRVRHSIKVRTVNGELRITEVVRADTKRGTNTKKFSNANPGDNKKAMEVIDKSMKSLLGVG